MFATTPRIAMQPSADVGRSVVIKGELHAQEDVTIAGRVEGTIHVDGHTVTVHAGGHVAGDITARAVIVAGTVDGHVRAAERLQLQASADVRGDLAAPRIGIADGASFEGRVEMPASTNAALRLAS
jgi:cytoskeletal protein CcmA (bactofilin family)